MNSSERNEGDRNNLGGTSDDDDLDPTEFLSVDVQQQESDFPDALELKNSGERLDLGMENNFASVINQELNRGEESGMGNRMYNSGIGSLSFSLQRPPKSLISGPFRNGSPELKSPQERSPVEFLNGVNQELEQGLESTLLEHEISLNKGDQKLNKLRGAISGAFKQLSENNFALCELHYKDLKHFESVLRKFQRWSDKRERLLSDIVSVKSDNSEHGHKLGELLDQSKGIDLQIDDLENKLRYLRQKKTVLNSEIQKTSSVLESKTSKSADVFRSLEKKGHDLILNFCELQKLTEEDTMTLIQSTPVNVSFWNSYERSHSKGAHNLTSRNPRIFDDIGGWLDLKERNILSSGPVPRKDSDLAEPASTEFLRHLDSNAYKEGLRLGAYLLNKLNEGINMLMSSFKNGQNDNKSTSTNSHVDDIHNTIKLKIDLIPIIAYINERINESKTSIRQASVAAEFYHHASIVWGDFVVFLKQTEDQVRRYLEDSTKSVDHSDKVRATLLSSLRQLKQKSQSSISKTPNLNKQFLIKAIKGESDAIATAVKTIAPDSINSDPSEVVLGLVDDPSSFAYLQDANSNSFGKKQDLEGSLSLPCTGPKNKHTLVRDNGNLHVSTSSNLPLSPNFNLTTSFPESNRKINIVNLAKNKLLKGD